MDDEDDLTGLVSPAQRAAVEALLGARDLAPRLRERLEMVKGAAVGWDVAAIAAWCGRTPRTVRRWLAAFDSCFRGGTLQRFGRSCADSWRVFSDGWHRLGRTVE